MTKPDVWIEIKLYGDYEGAILKVPFMKEFYPVVNSFMEFIKQILDEEIEEK